MDQSQNRGIVVAAIGAGIVLFSASTLVWAPSEQISDIMAMFLVFVALIGLGLLVAGAATALRS